MLKKFLLFLLITTGNFMAQGFDFANSLYYDYQHYHEQSLNHKRFKHSDIVPLIEHLKDKNNFEVNKAGTSAEGRDIYLIKIGHGEKKIFLWSQMHGDESTATMALFDIFNFLIANDHYNAFRDSLFNQATLYVMPMVNPDGAEVFQRRNSYEIDINRDFARQQTPEGIILRKVYDEIHADFGFNLHDQKTRYSVGNSFKSATLSFLAPAINYEKTVNPVRDNAIKLIGELYEILSSVIPGHIAKYKDDFEPRAFGDNFQRGGTSTILIESGGWKDDIEKQYIRKLNFITLLSSFRSIIEETYTQEDDEVYDEIPFNEENIMDVVLRNLKYKNKGHEYLIDIGINYSEVNIDSAKDFYIKSHIEDLGDLSVFFGYKDCDLKGYEIQVGETYPDKFRSLEEIEKTDLNNLYKQGYTNIVIDSSISITAKYTKLPINILTQNHDQSSKAIHLESEPNFIIKKNDVVKYVVINGFIHNVETGIGEIKNALIY